MNICILSILQYTGPNKPMFKAVVFDSIASQIRGESLKSVGTKSLKCKSTS